LNITRSEFPSRSWVSWLIPLALALGTAAALGLSRTIGSVLYGISPRDLTVFVLVPGVLVLIALMASYLPARRAAKVDPIVALRHE
jgi:putative ABC transport system permease protein